MTHLTAPLWVVDPDNVGKKDPTTPAVQITTSGVSTYQNGIAVSSAQITVPLTAAQIAGMFGARVPLVAAPGAGKVILPTAFIYENIFNTTAFANGGAVSVYYAGTNTKATADLSAANTALQASTSIISAAGVTTVFNGAALQAMVNVGLEIANATAAFDTGDGSARITIMYNILTL